MNRQPAGARVIVPRRRVSLGTLAVAAMVALALTSCGPANDRPLSGALPGSEARTPVRTPVGAPPTLSASEGLPIRAAAQPSPGTAVASPGLAASPSPLASPSAAAAPPIVRAILPERDGHVPAGAPVSLSAVLVGRGADLASASLSVNGADVGAEIDKRTAREWSIHANQTLGIGSYTAKVLVRDASGAAGGFTWQFLVGEVDPAANPAVPPSPVPKPSTP